MSYIVENNIQLSKNFSLSEFACKHCRRVRVDMSLVYALQKMRDIVGPIIIEIGYRCPEWNKTIPNAAENSLHIYGKAADIHCGQPYDEALRDIAEKCGFTGIGLYDTWIHVDVGDTVRRWDDRTKQKRYEHYELLGAHVVEVEPLALSHLWMKGADRRLPSELLKQHSNFVNCMFYDFPTGELFRLLIQDGQILSDIKSYDKNPNKGTMIIYKDGTVEIRTIGRNELNALKVSKIHLAFQGFNLDYEANGSKSLIESMRAEGWGSGKDDIYRRVCYRPGFGWNPSKKKAVIAVKKTNATGLRSLMRSLGCVYCGNTQAIGGDSGGSIALAVAGKLIYDENRTQVSVLKW